MIVRNFKLIEFDENHIYYDEKKIEINSIIKIRPGEITLNDEELLFYQIPGFSSNFKLLMEFYHNPK
jgi:hypothetical protein